MTEIDELGGPGVTRSPIPFVPSAGVRVVCRHAEAVDVPLPRSFARAHISSEVVAQGNALLPLPQLEVAFSYLPAQVGCPLFLFDAGHSESPVDDAYYRLLLVDEPTILATLRKATHLLHRFYNGRLTLLPDADVAWLVHELEPFGRPARTDAFTLGYLLRLVETFFEGATIYRGLACSNEDLLGRLAEICPPSTTLRRLASGAAVAIPLSLLCLPPPERLNTAAKLDELKDAIFQLPTTLVAAVSMIVRHVMPDYRPTIALVAEAAGMSVRTLQRMLDADGATFKEIVARERFKLARSWLLTTEMSVTDIARKLGYATPQSFTRAFFYWAGCSPSAFRVRLATPIEFEAPISTISVAFRERLAQGLG